MNMKQHHVNAELEPHARRNPNLFQNPGVHVMLVGQVSGEVQKVHIYLYIQQTKKPRMQVVLL